MEPIFVTGHRNPDTDSIVAAMAYASLQNALGNREYIAARLGPVNDETQTVLDYFGFEAPLQIKNVRTQVRDLEFDTPPVLNEQLTINSAWSVFENDDNISSLPVTDEYNHLCGVVTRGDIAAYDMGALKNQQINEVPIFNVLAALEGNIVNMPHKEVDTLSGSVVIALPRTNDKSAGLNKGCIAIMGDQPDFFKLALKNKASCIILCQAEYPREYKDVQTDTVVIYTPLDAYRAFRMLYLAAPITRIVPEGKIIAFRMDDFLDDVRKTVLENRFNSYPIVDHHGSVMGTLSRYHLLSPRRKRVVLVDHNELSQSIPGLEQAEIVAVIDHHRLADVQTMNPIYVRNEPVGSTNTIIATMFQEKGLVPHEKLAGLMVSAIASDTVMFKSPTCTAKDVAMAERLARIGNIKLETIGKLIFNAASDDKTPQELLYTDYKDFHIAGHDIGIGQVTCTDSKRVLKRKQELLDVMRQGKEERNCDMLLLMITDVLKEGTVLLYVGDDEIISQAFGTQTSNNEVFLENVVSRKKQIVPALSLLWG